MIGMDIVPYKNYNQIIFGNLKKKISYKRVLLEEVNSWRKTYPASLCDTVESQIIEYYKKHDEYTNLMPRTETSRVLWLSSMVASSAVLGYSF